jgi:high-affinity Fe2+/Pb2+ permease
VERRAKDVTLLEFRLPRVLIRGGEISIVFYFLVVYVGVFSGLDSVVMLPVVVCWFVAVVVVVVAAWGLKEASGEGGLSGEGADGGLHKVAGKGEGCAHQCDKCLYACGGGCDRKCAG